MPLSPSRRRENVIRVVLVDVLRCAGMINSERDPSDEDLLWIAGLYCSRGRSGERSQHLAPSGPYDHDIPF